MSGRIAITGFAHHAEFSPNVRDCQNVKPSAIDFKEQIPRRNDIRAQGPSQLLATYTAGEALDMADIKGQPDILDRTDVMVAVHSGERDDDMDIRLFEAHSADAQPEEASSARLNQELENLRPSLFLTQLQNLFAANISMVFDVLGMSVTFIGETHGGIRAIEEARNRIRSSRSKTALVGGVFNGLRRDILGYFPASQEKSTGSDIDAKLGQASGFVVLEDETHARSRGAPIKAFLGEVQYSECETIPSFVQPDTVAAILTHKSGSEDDDNRFIARLPGEYTLATIYDVSKNTGQLMEASFPYALCLATDILTVESNSSKQAIIASPTDQPPMACCVIEGVSCNV